MLFCVFMFYIIHCGCVFVCVEPTPNRNRNDQSLNIETQSLYFFLAAHSFDVLHILLLYLLLVLLVMLLVADSGRNRWIN